MRMVKSYVIVSLMFILLAPLVGCSTLGTYNPATGRREFIAIPTDVEVSMGRDIHTQIVSQYSLTQRKEQLAQLNRIGQRLAQVSDRQDYEYHFYLLENKDLNAFTTPGGNVYVFTGLMDKLQTSDEIASVLAHEIGHCAARHTIKKFQATIGYNLIGSIILGQADIGEQTKRIAALGSNVIMQLAMSAYGRQDEYEADRLGLKYMDLAGYDLQGMIKVFEVLKQESEGSRGPLILRTHPFVEDRIEMAKKEIDQIIAKRGRNTQ